MPTRASAPVHARASAPDRRSFFGSDNTCPICRAGYQTSCPRREPGLGCQAQYVRVPLADGTLVATPGQPDEALIPSLLALSDVAGSGWYAVRAARAYRAMDERRAIKVLLESVPAGRSAASAEERV